MQHLSASPLATDFELLIVGEVRARFWELQLSVISLFIKNYHSLLQEWRSASLMNSLRLL